MKKGIIWDFDDTLVHASVYFELSRERFTRCMEELQFPPEDVMEMLDRTDIENVKKMGGFMKECFPLAMVQTYSHFCRACGMVPDPEICRKVEEIGWWVFEQKPDPLPGALEVLERLRNKFVMMLATKGDPSVQWRRIEASGLMDFFAGVYVLKDKTAGEYGKIALEHGIIPGESWIVGNGIKSEINPGLKAGFNCIFIPNRHTWHFEMEEPAGEYITLKSIEMIPDLLSRKNMAVLCAAAK